jgi:hypothetical protein
MNYISNYIIVTNECQIISVSDNIDIALNYFGNYVNNNVTMLKSYNGNVSKFMNDLQKWKIVYYSNSIEQGYYYLDETRTLRPSNDRLNKVIYNLKLNNDVSQSKSNVVISKEINKIFIPSNEEDVISKDILRTENECNTENKGMIRLPISVNDMKLIKNQSTESLINSCLNNEIEISEEKLNKVKQLQESIKRLEEQRKQALEKAVEEEAKKKQKMKKIELKRKQIEERETKYRRKFLVDKKLYFVFKNEIEKGIRKEDNIPILFLKQWYIFKELESQSILSAYETDDNEDTLLNRENKSYSLIENELNVYKSYDKQCVDKDFGDSYSALFKSMDMNEVIYLRKGNTHSDSDSDDYDTDDSDSDESDDE